MVAVVHNGGLTIEELPAGTTLAGLAAGRSLRLADTQVLVNKQVEASPQAALRTGDVVDLYCEPAAAPATAAARLSPRSAPLPGGVLAARQAARVSVAAAADGGALKVGRW